MSDTPRTDALIADILSSIGDSDSIPDGTHRKIFANMRMIERDLTAAQATIADLTLKHQVACDTIERMKRDDEAVAKEFHARETLDKGRCKAIADLQAKLAEAQRDAEFYATHITNMARGLPDHACLKCVPDGPMLVNGFLCGYHKAELLLGTERGNG